MKELTSEWLVTMVVNTYMRGKSFTPIKILVGSQVWEDFQKKSDEGPESSEWFGVYRTGQMELDPSSHHPYSVRILPRESV